MNSNCEINMKGIWAIYHLFAIVFAFIVYGFWWGMLNIILPISPLVWFVHYLISLGIVKG